jgi:co-chaperonin GroES (HSP10)
MNEREQELREQERESTMQLANANKGMIEVERYAGADFNVDTDFAISKLLFDTLLVHFEDGDADTKLKGGIHVPIGAQEQAKVWRTGKVLMAGTGAKQVKAGDYVTFPNDKGINIKAVNVDGVGVVPHCIFIAEDRIFSISKKVV